tara:strand:- start:106 stop:1128 length:1023 start_codon:yes stop_codon:yes gene_type:complete
VLITTGTENVGVGNHAGKLITTGSRNTAVGSQAMQSGGGTASDNVAIGRRALKVVTSGGNNTIVGKGAAQTLTTGTMNSALGSDALQQNTTGSNNVAIGRVALAANTTADNNTAVGHSALAANTTGAQNTAVGRESMPQVTTGVNNSTLGYNTLYSAGLADDNTAVGYRAGYDVTTGDNNLFLGTNAGRSTAPNGTHTHHSNRIVLGDNNITNAHIKVAWTVTSDERDKADIVDFTKGLDIVNALRPVTFVWDMRSNYSNDLSVTPDGSKKSNRTEIGLIAQEVETVEKANGYGSNENDCLFIDKSENEKHYGLRYEKLIPVLINSIKELSVKVKALETG